MNTHPHYKQQQIVDEFSIKRLMSFCDGVGEAAALATESYQSLFCLPSRRPVVGGLAQAHCEMCTLTGGRRRWISAGGQM